MSVIFQQVQRKHDRDFRSIYLMWPMMLLLIIKKPIPLSKYCKMRITVDKTHSTIRWVLLRKWDFSYKWRVQNNSKRIWKVVRSSQHKKANYNKLIQTIHKNIIKKWCKTILEKKKTFIKKFIFFITYP